MAQPRRAIRTYTPTNIRYPGQRRAYSGPAPDGLSAERAQVVIVPQPGPPRLPTHMQYAHESPYGDGGGPPNYWAYFGAIFVTVLLGIGVVYCIITVNGLSSSTLRPSEASSPIAVSVQAKPLRAKRMGIAPAEYAYEFEVTAVGKIEGLRVPTEGNLPDLVMDRLTSVMLCCTTRDGAKEAPPAYSCGHKIALNGDPRGAGGYAKVFFDGMEGNPTVCRIVYTTQT